MNKEQALKVRVLQTGGKTVEEISQILNLPITEIKAKLFEIGYVPNIKVTPQPHGWGEIKQEKEIKFMKPTPNSYLSQQEKDNIIALYKAGIGVCEIAQKLGRGKSTVSRYVKEYSVLNEKKEPDENSPKLKENKILPNKNFNTEKEKSQADNGKEIDSIMKTLLESTEFYSKKQQTAFDVGRAYGKLECLRRM